MDANQFGCFAEYKFAIQAMEWGFNVSMPMLDASAYDLILEKDGTLFKFQIKSITKDRTDRMNRDDVQCVLRCNSKSYPMHLVDYFAIYVARDQGFYVIKNKGQKTMRLSTTGIYKDNFNTFAHIL